MTIQTDVQIEFVSDTIAGTATYVAAAQDPAIGALQLTNTEFPNGSARQLSITTSSGEIAGHTVVVSGTNASDQSITETLSVPTTAATFTGDLYFKTIISAFTSEPPWVGTISVGMANIIVQTIPGRTRLKGYSIAYGTVSGAVSFYDGVINLPTDFNATPISFITYTYNTSNLMINFQIPDDGVLYENGLTVTYQSSSTGSTIRMMNLFHG